MDILSLNPSSVMLGWMLVVKVGEEASVGRGHLQQPIAVNNSIPMMVNTWHILGSSTRRFIYKVREQKNLLPTLNQIF